MKKLLFILAIVLVSCSADETKQTVEEQNCYSIISRGFDSRGNFIIINYSNFVQKRYSVSDYQDYINQSQLCEPINLTEQPL